MPSEGTTGTRADDASVTEGATALGVVEQDMRRLMRELAEARFALNEQERASEATTKQLLLSLLEVLDAFSRVFKNVARKEEHITRQMKIWINNFHTVNSLLEKLLTEQGVTAIEILEPQFNPHWHVVAELVEEPARPEGEIIEVFKQGYVWRGQVLRKAEVIVAAHAGSDALREHPEQLQG
jgi:molecular chaperone GrpE